MISAHQHQSIYGTLEWFVGLFPVFICFRDGVPSTCILVKFLCACLCVIILCVLSVSHLWSGPRRWRAVPCTAASLSRRCTRWDWSRCTCTHLSSLIDYDRGINCHFRAVCASLLTFIRWSSLESALTWGLLGTLFLFLKFLCKSLCISNISFTSDLEVLFWIKAHRLDECGGFRS